MFDKKAKNKKIVNIAKGAKNSKMQKDKER